MIDDRKRERIGGSVKYVSLIERRKKREDGLVGWEIIPW